MRTWIEISSQNLKHNINQFRNLIGEEVKIAGIVKSNAYGHGIREVAKVINDKVDWFGVDSLDEALILKKEGIVKPILILGYTELDRLEEVVVNGFHQTVANIETLNKFVELTDQGKAFIHLKIETGTSRQGILFDLLDSFLDIIKQNENIKLAGVSTHFANIEDTTDHSYAEEQLLKYSEAVRKIEEAGETDFIKHTACSAAAVLFPETYFDMVRVGISTYGLWSSTETKVSAKQKELDVTLKPVLTWKTKIAHIKELPAGTAVSYGCTEKLAADSKLAVLPVGYWDGFDRGLSSVGTVLVNGQRCKVIGRVCMNMTVIDVTHVENAKLEDEVVLLGEQTEESVSAEEIAEKLNTINYEVVTRINSVIKRIVI
ncbi:alanine racemase [Candidatus Falkowbacteria bacterium]|jgi:alanine racemase|nr:alanine racemase [Candidatus Falkowbacteria bacterium]MBT7006948.1 alanine racemase [Candidatus Falkowbacteria bacterium]